MDLASFIDQLRYGFPPPPTDEHVRPWDEPAEKTPEERAQRAESPLRKIPDEQ